MLKRCTLTIILASLLACGDGTKSQADGVVTANKVPGVTYASGLSVEKTEGGIICPGPQRVGCYGHTEP